MLLARFLIVGHSMEPTLLDGKSVLISSIPFLFSKPKVDDIIAFKTNRKIYIKRIIKISNDNYFMKGDNIRDSLDSRRLGWIKRQDILGKVITLHTTVYRR